MPKKRKPLNLRCVDIADSRINESRGFIRVRIELPFSNFVSSIDHKLTKDIHLDIDWKVFRTLLSGDDRAVLKFIFNKWQIFRQPLPVELILFPYPLPLKNLLSLQTEWHPCCGVLRNSRKERSLKVCYGTGSAPAQ